LIIDMSFVSAAVVLATSLFELSICNFNCDVCRLLCAVTENARVQPK
jgi:hypothetical protein